MDFTVIGLLGPAGSGKDLVADWLIAKGFVKVAFADPMKRFVNRCFIIPLNSLWGPSDERNKRFKIDTFWWYTAVSNLPEAAQEIVQEVLPDGCRASGYLSLLEWFSWLRKTYPDEISAREILQTLGTEWGRKVKSDLWPAYAYEVVNRLKEGGAYTQVGGPYEPSLRLRTPAGVVIPDHRFRNEVEGTQQVGGHLIRLRRLAQEEKVVGIAGHVSESEQKAVPDDLFDLVLELREFTRTGDDGCVVDTDALRRALEPVYQEELWKRRKTTGQTLKLELAPRSS